MGICWSNKSHDDPAASTTVHFVSSGISQTTSGSQTTSTRASHGNNVSGNSNFSAPRGDEAFASGQIMPTPILRIFTFAELKAATRNFRSDAVLGEGGFGKVFKGWLDEKARGKSGSGTVITVKKFNSESMEGLEECRSELNFQGMLSHSNLVRLLGYCWEDEKLLLVYEFMQKGSLNNHLFGPVQPLPWNIRLKIAIGAARGLAFLHTSDKQVIHRNFKSSKILLDESYTAKISGFGLAKLGPSASQSHVTTRVMGTYGYAAPEYIATGHLYVKSDVYGFGVVLVEILTGLRAVDTKRPSGQHNLVEWIKPYLSGKRKITNIIDSRLQGKYPYKAAYQVAQLSLKCLEAEPKNRPSMKEVLKTLEQLETSNQKPKEPIVRSTHSMAHCQGQQPLKHPSPLPINPDRIRSYQHSPRVTTVGISQTTSGSQTTSTRASHGSHVSGNSPFSSSSEDEAFDSGQILPTPNLRIFTFAELKAATRNFKSDMVLREGGFGKVFKGWLDEKAPGKCISGTVIAVKKLNSESLLGFEEWRSEVNFLGSLSHPNLVRLLGYCWEDKELLLVYEFVQKGSLENHLFGRGAAIQPLPWNIRLKIAIGAARGLAFLHTLDKQVIYRDIKASNILLDRSYTAKISDFGLAKLGPPASQSHVTTRVMGTYGCAAPEYVGSGHLHVKSDVYGFGVVLVEILTGLPNRRSGQHNLVDWIKPYLSEKRKCRYIIDSKLQGKYPSKAAYQIAQLSLKCLETEQINRPSMKEVLEILEQLEASNQKSNEPRVRSLPIQWLVAKVNSVCTINLHFT